MMYYVDTSVLLVYTLLQHVEPIRYKSTKELIDYINLGKYKAITSFYALQEVYIYALQNAPEFDIGCKFGKEAIIAILTTKIQVAPLLNRIERKMNSRFFTHLPDSSDIPHATSALVSGCSTIVAYDDHFKIIEHILHYQTPEDIIRGK